MRVLIIATPRSGSTALRLGLARNLKVPAINELYIDNRYSMHFSKYPFIWPESCVLKILTSVPPGNFFDYEHFLYFAKPLVDKVILLTRKNIVKAAESLNHAEKSGNYSSEYSYEASDISNTISKYENYNREIFNLSDKFNIPVSYYEDWYSDDKELIQNLLKLYSLDNIINFYTLYENYLDTKHKLRKNE